MNDEIRRQLYEQQISLYGRVILSRDNAAWYILQLANTLKAPPVAVLPVTIHEVRQHKVAAR